MNLPEVEIFGATVAAIGAGVADCEGLVFNGRDRALAFQSGAVVVLAGGLWLGSTAKTPMANAQGLKETANRKNSIRARIWNPSWPNESSA